MFVCLSFLVSKKDIYHLIQNFYTNLEPIGCCPIIRLTGAKASFLNQKYHVIQAVVNYKHVYVSEDGLYAIYFHGSIGWMVGYLSELMEGKLDGGFMFNNYQFETDCPRHSARWLEWHYSSWEFGDVDINCE